MQIEIQALGFSLTEALQQRVTKRLSSAFHGRDEVIRQVSVRLSDINGPRGGEDKCCQVRIAVERMSDVVVKAVQSDLYAAIDRAADRAGGALSRRLNRQRIRRRLFGSAFGRQQREMVADTPPSA